MTIVLIVKIVINHYGDFSICKDLICLVKDEEYYV
jgi:sialic acid synthase SpsE